MAASKRLKKFVLIGGGALLLLGVIAVLALPALVDVDRHRPRIEELAQEKIGREVKLGELGLSLFPGVAVTVDGLEVSDGAGGRLAGARQVRLGAGLGALLGGRLEIGHATLEEPEVVLRRDAEGRFELLELLGPRGESAGESRVSIAAVRLRDGRVVLEDASLGRGEVVRHEFTELDLDVEGLDRPGGPYRVRLSARLPSVSPEARVAWDGRLAPDLTGRGRLELEGIELASLRAHASALAGRDLSALAGRLEAEAELARDAAGGLEVDGRFAGRGLVLPREGAPALKLPDLELGLGLESDAEGAEVERFELETGSTTLSAKGRLELTEDARTLVLEVTDSVVRLEDVKALLGAVRPDLPLKGLGGERVHLGGRVRLVVAADSAELRRLDVDGLRVSGLRLALVRRADGRFDFQTAAPAKKSSKTGPAVSARDVVVKDVELRFEDRAVGDGAPVVTELSDLELEIAEWVPDEKTPIRLSASLAGGRASLEGSAGPIGKDSLPVDLRVRLEGLDVAALAPYLERYAGIAAESGRLEADSRLSGEKSTRLAVKGHLELDDARVELPGRGLRDLDLRVDHDLVVERGGDRVQLKELTVGLPGGPASFEGVLELPEGGPVSFDVGTRGPLRLTTADLDHLIALTGAQTGVRLEAQEPLVLDARLSRRKERFSVDGSVELREVLVRHALLGETPLQVAQANVALQGERVALDDLQLRLGATDLAGSLSLSGFDRHRVDFDLVSNEADLDELFAFVGRVGAGGDDAAAKPAGDDALGRTTAEGRLRVGRAGWGGLSFSDFDARVGLDRRRLTVTRSRVGLYGGTASADVGLDLSARPASFESTGELNGVRVRDLLSAGVGYQELAGVGGGRFRLSGRAGDPETAVRSVRGGGTLNLTDGVLGGLNVLAALERAEVFGERSLAELGARLAQEGTTFERLDAEYELSDGVLRLARLDTTTPEARIFAKGPVNLLEQRLDLDLDVTFDRELSARMREEGSRAAKWFWSQGEQAVRIPLKLVGRVTEPKAVIDWNAAMGQYAEGEIGRQLGDLLGGALGGGRREEPAPSEPAPQQPATSTPPEAPAPSASGPSVDIRRARLSGNFLVPDVKVEAVLNGRDLFGATVVVTDSGGRELARDENAFVNEVNAHYAGGASRSESTRIEVGWRLDGERVAGRKGLKVAITPRTRGGERGATATEAVAAKSLF